MLSLERAVATLRSAHERMALKLELLDRGVVDWEDVLIVYRCTAGDIEYALLSIAEAIKE